MLKFYGYKKCGTSRKAEKALESLGVAYDFVDITENPPCAGEMRKLIACAGIDVKKAFNTSGLQYKEGAYKDKIKGLEDAKLLKLLDGQGRLMKRPMITDGKRATVGYVPGDFEKVWCHS